MITGGIPPLIGEVCSADKVLVATYQRVLTQNAKFCKLALYNALATSRRGTCSTTQRSAAHEFAP